MRHVETITKTMCQSEKKKKKQKRKPGFPTVGWTPRGIPYIGLQFTRATKHTCLFTNSEISDTKFAVGCNFLVSLRTKSRHVLTTKDPWWGALASTRPPSLSITIIPI